MQRRILRLLGGAVAAIWLVACGGGGGNNGAAAPTPAPSGIGPAGGTVSGPSGSKVVIPAGALTSTIDIAVAQSSAGFPQLPPGLTAAGEIFAFTPHGTTFAAPVTMTVPFNPALVPAGATPVLYKTDATQSAWIEVTGATAAGNSMSGEVTGFSFALVAVPKPTLLMEVYHEASGTETLVNGTVDMIIPRTPSRDILVDELGNLGPLFLHPSSENGIAEIEVYATPAGGTYWVSAEAPQYGDMGQPWTGYASKGSLNQVQTYRKLADAATLKLVVSQTTLELADYVPKAPPNKAGCAQQGGTDVLGTFTMFYDCGNLLDARTDYQVSAWADVPIKDSSGKVTGSSSISLAKGTVFAHLWGYGKGSYSPFASWHFTSGQDGSGNLKFDVVPSFDYNDNVEQTPDPSYARARLNSNYVIDIPLGDVPLNGEFRVNVWAIAKASDRRQADSYAGARFRDPQKSSGIDVQAQGVELVSVPADSVFTPPLVEVTPQPPCDGNPDPASGTMQFQSASGNAIEGTGEGMFPVWITRSGGGAGEVTLRIATSDGSAQAGRDYTAVSKLVRFGDGEQGQRYVELPVLDNQTVDGDRKLTLALSELGGCAVIGLPAAMEVSIVDDELPPPASSYTLGGTITGLAGTGLALQTGVGDVVSPTTNGSFTFPAQLADNASYVVSVMTQPSNPAQVCTVSNGSGTVAGANVTSVSVACVTGSSGGLDATFGAGGKVSSTASPARAMAVQSDGKLVVVGGMTLSRFNADGSPDTGFGTAGKVPVVANGGGLDAMYAVAVQADGKIVVAGGTAVPLSNYDDMVVLRYDSSGRIDTSFGTGGKVVCDFAGSTDRAYAVLVQGDGKIVATGIATLGTLASPDQDIAMLRLLPDGSLDAAFGTGGKLTTNVAGSGDFGYAAARQSDGKYVVAGRVAANGGSNPDFGVVRYMGNGALDTAFGTSGIARVDFGGTVWDEAADLAIQNDGKIIVAGQAAIGATYRYALLRLDSSGSLDTGFGTAGLVSTDFSGKNDYGRALTLQSDGRIVVAGQVSSTQNGDMGVARYLATGAIDSSFGDAGLLRIDVFGANDDARDVAIQGDGKIVVAGSALNGSAAGLALVRAIP